MGERAARAELFEGTGVELEFCRGYTPWRFPSPEDYVRFMESRYGPTLEARERLTAEGTWGACRDEILAMAKRRNEATDGTLRMSAEYLVVAGRRTGEGPRRASAAERTEGRAASPRHALRGVRGCRPVPDHALSSPD